MSKKNKNLSKRGVFYVIALLLIFRLVLNLNLEPLSIFFIFANGILLVLLITKQRVFPILFIIFMVVDSLIGTYLFTQANNLGFEYYGTIIINLTAIAIVYFNPRKVFN